MERIDTNHKSTFAAVAVIMLVALMAFIFAGCTDKVCPAYTAKVVKSHQKYIN